MRIRLSLPSRHAKRWTAMPPRLREEVAGIVFGAFSHGFNLGELATVASELRLARLSLNNVLQLTLCNDAPVDVRRVHAALDRVNAILGEKTR